MTRFLALLAFVALAAIGGCAGPGYNNASGFRAAVNAPYQLASGDRLRIIVFGQDSLSNSFSVDAPS